MEYYKVLNSFLKSVYHSIGNEHAELYVKLKIKDVLNLLTIMLITIFNYYDFLPFFIFKQNTKYVMKLMNKRYVITG